MELCGCCSAISGQDGKQDTVQGIVMYPVHAVLLVSSVEPRRNLIYNEHILVVLLPVEYEGDYSAFQRIEELGCSGDPAISKTSELVPLENFSAKSTSSKVMRRS